MNDLVLALSPSRAAPAPRTSAAKVPTIMPTNFIPLTFSAGVYAMNFASDASPYNMLELRWRCGYSICLAVTSVIALALVWGFERKGWILARREPSTPIDAASCDPRPARDARSKSVTRA